MKNLIEKNDFEIIEISDNSKLIFYSPNTQLFPITDIELDEYFQICKGDKLAEESFLKDIDINNIYKFANKQFEESQQPIKVRKPKNQINSIIFPISGTCNLKCDYCFARVDDNFVFKSANNEEAKSIIDYLFLNQKLQECDICFFGGEPLLNFKTIKFVLDYIRENYYNKKIGFSITTNGTILNKKKINFIINNKIAVLVSIDGSEELNKHRIFKNGKNCFNRTFSNINKLKLKGINLQLRATITNDSLHIVEIHSFFERLEVPFNITFAYESENKNHILSKYSNNLQSIENQFKDLTNFYLNIINEGKDIYCMSLKDKLKVLYIRRKDSYACSGGHSLFSITSDGEIYSCEHLAGISKFSIGNISTAINKAKLKKLISTNVEKMDECKNCWLRYICCGGCFSSNISTTGVATRQEEGKCNLIKIEWKFVIKLYYSINKYYPDFFKASTKQNKENTNC